MCVQIVWIANLSISTKYSQFHDRNMKKKRQYDDRQAVNVVVHVLFFVGCKLCERFVKKTNKNNCNIQ